MRLLYQKNKPTIPKILFSPRFFPIIFAYEKSFPSHAFTLLLDTSFLTQASASSHPWLILAFLDILKSQSLTQINAN